MARAVVFLTIIFVATGFLASEAWAGQVRSSAKLRAEVTIKPRKADGTIQMRKAGGDPQTSGKPFLRKAR